jgi:hypothetical protein
VVIARCEVASVSLIYDVILIYKLSSFLMSHYKKDFMISIFFFFFFFFFFFRDSIVDSYKQCVGDFFFFFPEHLLGDFKLCNDKTFACET